MQTVLDEPNRVTDKEYTDADGSAHSEQESLSALAEEEIAPTDGKLGETAEAYVPIRKRGFRYGCYLFVKRTFDILSSGTMILLIGWLLLVFLFVKWAEDRHNPVYVSKRVGKDGKVFKILKILIAFSRP